MGQEARRRDRRSSSHETRMVKPRKRVFNLDSQRWPRTSVSLRSDFGLVMRKQPSTWVYSRIGRDASG
jgi:hypothetical protein